MTLITSFLRNEGAFFETKQSSTSKFFVTRMLFETAKPKAILGRCNEKLQSTDILKMVRLSDSAAAVDETVGLIATHYES